MTPSGVSLDETTTLEDVTRLIDLFEGTSIAAATTGIPEALIRPR